MSSPRRRRELAEQYAAENEVRNQAETERASKSWWYLIEDASDIYELKRIMQEMAEHLPERSR